MSSRIRLASYVQRMAHTWHRASSRVIGHAARPLGEGIITVAMVTIFDQTYMLPAVTSTRFQHLHSAVRAQQRLIHEGTRPRSRLLGILPRPPVPVSVEERWQELDALVHNYETILQELRTSKDAYQAFFAQMAADVRQFVLAKNAESRHLEEERLAAHARAAAVGNQAAQRAFEDNGELLLHTVRLRGQATLLLLKKITLYQQGLSRLVEDQQVQQHVLQALVEDMDLQRQAYQQRRRIEEHLREAEEMARVAQQFEAHLRDHLGPLQSLIEQVVQVDSSLHRTVEEIETLTRQIASQSASPLPGSEALDERLLDFLTRSQVKKERLLHVWEQWERDDGAAEALDVEMAISSTGTPSPVLTALGNLEILVEARMTLSTSPRRWERRRLARCHRDQGDRTPRGSGAGTTSGRSLEHGVCVHPPWHVCPWRAAWTW